MKQRAVFFDRDGTLNVDPGYLGDPSIVELFPEAAEAISLLRKFRFKIIVISNQAGIARGLITASDVEAVNARINELLNDSGAKIDAFYYCPFHPDFSTEEECQCRKPSPQLVFKAAEELDIQLEDSYFVGDRILDVECGINAGLKTVLINRDGNTEQNGILHVEGKRIDLITHNLMEAAKFIINDYLGGN